MIGKLSKHEYAKLGMMLVSENPSIANELLSIKYSTPTETDVSLIHKFYSKYCELKPLPHFRCDRYDFRLLFIACMVKTYEPSLFEIKNQIGYIKKGVVMELSLAFNSDQGNISRCVRKSIMAYKIYPAFNDEVKRITEVLK